MIPPLTGMEVAKTFCRGLKGLEDCMGAISDLRAAESDPDAVDAPTGTGSVAFQLHRQMIRMLLNASRSVR